MPFSFFITCCTSCGMEWDTGCRPTDDPFWTFLSLGAQAAPKQYLLVYFGQSSKKDNHPGPFPQQGSCTSLQIWDELGVTWQTMQIVVLLLLLFFFFAISGANFKHSLSMILSGLGSLTVWELPRRVSYFVFLKTTLVSLFRTFGIPFVSCLQNLHFSMIILPPTLRFLQIFSSFYNR